MKYILYLLLIITSFAFAQTEPSKPDSLLNLSQSNKNLNENLKSQIDSLKKIRDSLKQKLRMELRELYIMKYGKETGDKISMGKIWTGMTEEMIKDSWGEPDSITVNKQNWGTYTQWYYGDITYFFKDGILFDWEDTTKTQTK